MSNYIISNGELYKVDDVSNDELRHHKYTSKYRKNGKWVYIYDEGAAKQGKAKDAYVGPFHKPKVTKISSAPTRNNSKFAKEEKRNESDQSKAKKGNSWTGKFNYGKRTVKKGFDKAGDWGKNAVEDVGNWGKKAAKDVGNWGKKAAKDVGGYAEKGLKWVDNTLFGKKKQPKKATKQTNSKHGRSMRKRRNNT